MKHKRRTLKTIADVKAFNKEMGFYFFSKDTMRFFNSRIESGLLQGGFFITSEQREVYTKRMYSIRRVDFRTGDIRTVGKHQGYSSKQEAKEALKEIKKNLISH